MNFDEYSSKLNDQLENAYQVAENARTRGFDPSDKPEIPVAEDLAERVEKLVGPKGVADDIRELEEKHSRETVAFRIAEKIVEGEYGGGNREELIEQTVRTALGILTEGVAVAAPTEGISNVSTVDGRLRMSFAGPIRAAGGTGAALSVLIGDYVRRRLGIDSFEAPPELVERFVEEVKLYDEVTSLQYLPSDREVEIAIKNIPVEIAGEGTEDKTVSARNRDVPGVETDRIRGGAMLVVAEGILQKVPKLLKHVENLEMSGWGWLKELKETSEAGEESEEEPEEKEPKYLKDVIAGRPVLGYPGEKGGFRLRYGRARNTGLAAGGVHPATMRILNDHLAPGTQIKIEAPGKATITNPVDTVEGPLVKLENGDVVRVSDENQAEGLVGKIEKILSLGDILLGYGEFVENNHPLLPAGWCEEWWSEEVREATEETDGESSEVATYIDPPFQTPPPQEAVEISEDLGVPLHPAYTYPYHDLEPEEIEELGSWLADGRAEIEGSTVRYLSLPYRSPKKKLLEALEIPHRVKNEPEGHRIVVEKHAHPLSATLCEIEEDGIEFVPLLESFESSTELVNRLAPFPIRKKAPTRIGARMGRPEKAEPREMSPPVRVLYPVGNYGGSTRSIGKAAKRPISVLDGVGYDIKSQLEEVGIRTVGDLADAEPRRICHVLENGALGNNGGGKKARKLIERAKEERDLPLDVQLFSCPACGTESTSRVCPECENEDTLPVFEEKEVNLERRFDSSMNRLGIAEGPSSTVKGVKGLTNEGNIAEPLEKGFLRAKNEISIYKDGTVRLDLTEAPLSHFKPREVNVSVERLRELGYEEDVNGKSLEGPDQIVEMKPQDLLLPASLADYFVRTAQYVDDLLEKLYGMEPFYEAVEKEDLVGALLIALAPHISAGVVGRIIGFTEADIGYAHPYIHAGVRRNADGDEYSVMLLLQALLDFSEKYLPAGHGGRMDTPLVITHPLNPEEIDDEAHNIDVAKRYSKEFYEATLEGAEPEGLSEIVEDRLGAESQYHDLHFTEPHDNSDISMGPKKCRYKSLGGMEEKTRSQMSVAEKLISVDEDDTAERLLNRHFLKDLRGNIRAFAGQRFRCTNCETKYRRVPMSGKCHRCGNELILTVHKGSVEKYVDIAKEIAEEYDVSDYMEQWIELTSREIESLFVENVEESGSGDGKQKSLADFAP
ncbi:hypothetical protein AKJ38_00510 [candidate division MSBL1 archaeon SCGC-AAA259I14]|uniref:DNA polymerase II large subunit n=1 Tax=candidate division MSBL1 archaeon SCGC-AAA259I14 TaxID=1698268 RepID=A0A133UTX0_9EURY|nr:hypothetical protein AKJ38_00510 [candidate division MSBL1 archaeon SCGC-AAA259I14]